MTVAALCISSIGQKALADWPHSHAYLLVDIIGHYSSACERVSVREKKTEKYNPRGSPSLWEVISCLAFSPWYFCPPSVQPICLYSLSSPSSEEHTHRKTVRDRDPDTVRPVQLFHSSRLGCLKAERNTQSFHRHKPPFTISN